MFKESLPRALVKKKKNLTKSMQYYQVWNVDEKLSSTLLWNIKDHKSAVTCFSVCETGESVLSGSADKTIRV